MYAASWSMPRKGFAGARTSTPAARRMGITPAQFEASAKAPWTSATVNGAGLDSGVPCAIAEIPFLSGTIDVRTGDVASRAATWDIPRPAAETAAAPAIANRPRAGRRERRASGITVDTGRFMEFLLAAKWPPLSTSFQ